MKRRTFIATSSQAFIGSVWLSHSEWQSGACSPKEVARPIPATRYVPDKNGILSRDGKRFGNRPLYGANRPSLVLGGDRPVLRYLDKPFPAGTLMLSFVRQGVEKWLHDFAEVESWYHAGQMRWTMRDPAFIGLTVILEALSLADANGFVARLSCQGAKQSDVVISLYGGLPAFSDSNLFWRADPGLHPSVVTTKAENHQGSDYVAGLNDIDRAFDPRNCVRNQVQVSEDRFTVTGAPSGDPSTSLTVRGWCDNATQFTVADASVWSSPTRLCQSKPAAQPVACGRSLAPQPDSARYWVVESVVDGSASVTRSTNVLAALFVKAQERLNQVSSRVILNTPDLFFNASIPATVVAMDACYYPPVFVHGGMSWNIPFPGWRTMYGPTCLGWHEHVRAEGFYYLDSQRTQPGSQFVQADPERGLSLQASNTRFYGQGRIRQNQQFYNMQEVFFDQLIHAWRWTGNAELEKRLLPALELHLDWLRDCFDPDDDGVYESYLNVWASDSLWYNGGGTAQSTAYAYQGHRAAAELCQRAGEVDRATKHLDRARQIRRGLMSSLWIPERGYLAEYREAAHHRRRHDDACLYTIFLPIDAGLMQPAETIQMLDYTEWGLERVPQAAGGEQCFTSNFVPLIWSVRELDTADTLHLALAYYQAGLGQQAWKLLEGSYKESMFNAVVPGGLVCEPMGKKYTSTDFGETVSMYGRVVIEGLFGVKPDRPNGRVSFQPQFPSDWETASLETSDFSVSFGRKNGVDTYRVTLSQPADIEVILPIYTHQRPSVSSSDAAFNWSVQPGYGQALVVGRLKGANTLEVNISQRAGFVLNEYSYRQTNVGDALTIHVPGGRIKSMDDPQRVLIASKLKGGDLVGTVSTVEPGRHTVLTLVDSGELSWWHVVKLTVRNQQTEALNRKTVTPRQTTKSWRTVSINDHFNADLRAVYQQSYQSPRPGTTSAQLGADGFSPWTYSFWKIKPPKLTFANLPNLTDAAGRLCTKSGIPFQLESGDKNIGFTSLWDNWPTSHDFAVGQTGSEIALLVAGTTNPMQTKIANGVLSLMYADGRQECIELIHPTNYWSVDGIYDYETDGFALPALPPPTVRLGDHCRAVVVTKQLRSGMRLESVRLETLSAEVVIGLMAISIR